MKNLETTNGRQIYRSMNRRRNWMVAGSLVAFAIMLILDFSIGSSKMSWSSLFHALLEGPIGRQNMDAIVVWDIRLPMTLTSVFVGGSLAAAGLQLQTITNNPLASPYTFGITSSASFGAAISITTGFSIAGQLWLGTSVLAFLFAFLVSIGIYYIGKMRGMSTTTIVLTGIMMNFFFTALQQLLQYRASAEVAQIISSWTFGNLARASWTSVFVSAALMACCSAAFMMWSWRLTALSAGEENAESLGVNVKKLRVSVFFISSMLIAGSVAFIGTVGFVGLIAPHGARLLSGDDQRYLLPLSVLLGAMLMLLSSIVSKLLTVGAVLPVGIVTSLIGVPFLFLLMMRKKD